MSRATELFALPWPELSALAWETARRHHALTVQFAVPSLKHYHTEHYRNSPGQFAAVSISGNRCDRRCGHCEGQLLLAMAPATSPAALVSLGHELRAQGCQGLLLSGACDESGAVPLAPYVDAIAHLKGLGLSVIAHTGLPDRATAFGLARAGLDLALLDVVGNEATIREVLRLERSPADYAAALSLLAAVGLRAAPHVVVGLHYGQLLGELAALEMIAASQPAAVVVVALRPLAGTAMAGIAPVPVEQVAKVLAVARLLCPGIPLSLGCARPAGPAKAELERLALKAGVNSIAYPDPETVVAAANLGLLSQFDERCCALAAFPTPIQVGAPTVC